MKKCFTSVLILIVFILFSIFLVKGSFLPRLDAANLNPIYLFFERTQTNQETDIILMFTPSSDFVAGGDLRISFLDDVGSWCENPVIMTVVGIESSPVDKEGWAIDMPLPEAPGFSFQAECTPGDIFLGTYDTILIENLGELNTGISYGILVLKNSGFKTSPLAGGKRAFIEITDGITSESTEFPLNLIQSDSLTISAKVMNISTITCAVSNSSLSFGELSKVGSHSTVQHSLTTTANLTEGYYWAAYGQGDGNIAGLWKSTSPTSLIPSPSNTTVNLLTNYGFGLVISSPTGTVVNDFAANNPGVFGGINSGYQQARLIFYEENPETSPLSMTVTLGVRAGVAAEAGGYSETLTYFCGGFY